MQFYLYKEIDAEILAAVCAVAKAHEILSGKQDTCESI